MKGVDKEKRKKRKRLFWETHLQELPTISKTGHLLPLRMPLGSKENDEKIVDSDDDFNNFVNDDIPDLGLYYWSDTH
jgi:hypothetical protein